MTISSTTTEVIYTGDGSTTAFPTTFPFFGTSTSAELTVIERVIATGAETTKSNGTDFTVSGGSGTTGTVTAAVAPANTVKWLIKRNTTKTQETDYVENDPFPAESHEDALDRLTLIAQEAAADGDKAFKYSDTYSGGASTTVPDPSAGKALKWNAGATALENSTYDPDEQATLAAASAAAASASETAAAASASAAASSASAASSSASDAQSFATQAQAAAYGWVSITNITTGTTNLETTDTRKYYKLDASGGAITINLPAIGSDEGMVFRFEVVNADNTITIARDGTDYINGVNGNYTLSNVGTIIDFISDDATPDNWLASFASNIQADGTTISQSGTTFSVATGGVDSAQIADGAVDPVHITGSINAQTGTTYTFVIGDAFKVVTCTNASAVAVTIPLNASVAFPVGARIDVIAGGAGAVTITGDTGVTVNGVSAGGAAISNQYSGVSLLKTATDTWIMFGDHAAVA